MIAKKGEYARRAVGMKRVEQETGVDRRTEIGTPTDGIICKNACSDAPGKISLNPVFEPSVQSLRPGEPTKGSTESQRTSLLRCLWHMGAGALVLSCSRACLLKS